MSTKWFAGCLLGLLLLSAGPLAKRMDAAEPKGQAKADAPVRKWTQDDGKTFEARFVGIERRVTPRGTEINFVTAQQADGKKITLRLFRLCQADKDYLKEVLVSQGKPLPSALQEPTKPESPTSAVNAPPAPAKPESQAEPTKPRTEVATTTAAADKEDKGQRRQRDVDSAALQERIDKITDGKALLRRILKGFPANCVVAEVAGPPKPVKIDEDKQKVTVRVPVRLRVDEAALATFRKRLLVVLDEFKEDDWDESWTFEGRGERLVAAKKDAARADAEFVRAKGKEPEQQAGQAVTDEIAVYVNTGRNDDWTSLEWKAFALDQMLADVFDDCTGRHGECALSVVSKAGDTIPLDRFPLDDSRLGGASPVVARAKYGDGGRAFFVSATFLRDAACSRHVPTVTVVREIEIPESLLDRLQALKCETRFVAGDKGGK